MVPRNETGSPIATQNEWRKLKNTHMVRNTRTRPCEPLRSSMLSRSRTIDETSWVSAKVMPGGPTARCSSRKALSASTTSRVSSPLLFSITR